MERVVSRSVCGDRRDGCPVPEGVKVQVRDILQDAVIICDAVEFRERGAFLIVEPVAETAECRVVLSLAFGSGRGPEACLNDQLKLGRGQGGGGGKPETGDITKTGDIVTFVHEGEPV